MRDNEKLGWMLAFSALLMVASRLRGAASALAFLGNLATLLPLISRIREEKTARPAATAMTRHEALAVLGLAEGARADDVHAAHRQLIQKMHPDVGGSSYLASKINEARDFLLRS